MLIFRSVRVPLVADCFHRMASRKAQKEAARERRLVEERARAERERRARRLRMVGGVVVVAIALVAVAIAVSSSGSTIAVIKPNSPAARKAQASVNSLLQGIPQKGDTLGSPSAPVTVTEFGDLECPVCKSFALGAENQLISNEVRAGKVKLVFRSLETASGTANGSMFVPQQASALAAGQQKLGWNYILLFYREQGDETTTYVNDNFLAGLAKQVSGLNYGQWTSDRQSSSLSTQVTADRQAAANAGYSSTPTLVVTGPKSQTQPIVGSADYAALQSAIKSVS
jgi:protein-disulfide isomerase